MINFKPRESMESVRTVDQAANNRGDILLGKYKNDMAHQRIIEAQDSKDQNALEKHEFAESLKELQDWCIGMIDASAQGSEAVKDFLSNTPRPELDIGISCADFANSQEMEDMAQKASGILGDIYSGIAAVWDQSITASLLRGVMDLLGKMYDSLLEFLGIGNDIPDDFMPGNYEQRAAEGLRLIFTPEVVENWGDMTVAQREQYVVEYTDYLSKVLGVNIKEIRMVDLPPNYGGSMSTRGVMELNSKFVESSDVRDLGRMIEVISHEVRHAFQFAAIKNPERYGVPKETAQMWNDNLKNYVQPEDDPCGYWDQPLEVDARKFASDVMRQSGVNIPRRM